MMPGVFHYRRHEWTDTAPGGSTGNHPVEAFIHYDSTPDAERVVNLAMQKNAMRNILRSHVSGNGWADIGYHYVIFQPWGNLSIARVFDARPVDRIPAAQLNHNTNTLAIQVYAGPGDKLKPLTQRAILALLKRYPGVRTLGGHRDVVATACPGDVIYNHIPALARKASLRVFR
jgi:hypothetical protein